MVYWMHFVKFHDRLISVLISGRPKGPITTTLQFYLNVIVDKSRTEADIRSYVIASIKCVGRFQQTERAKPSAIVER